MRLDEVIATKKTTFNVWNFNKMSESGSNGSWVSALSTKERSQIGYLNTFVGMDPRDGFEEPFN